MQPSSAHADRSCFSHKNHFDEDETMTGHFSNPGNVRFDKIVER